MDIWTKEKRSEVMSKIKSKDTKPEKLLRSALHKEGYRFRIHKKGLSGNPDIVLPKYKTVIYVNGCFWHLHKDCRDGHIPKTNKKYWKEKLLKNVERDKLNQKACEKLGWNVIVVWECEIKKDLSKTIKKIKKHLCCKTLQIG